MTPTDIYAPAFHRTAQSLLAARVERTIFLALPRKDGGFTAASGCVPDTPPDAWTAADVFSFGPHVADEDGFRAHVAEIAGHRRERTALNRRSIHTRAWTPWGWAQSADVYAGGVICYSTAGHGGFNLTPEKNALVHLRYRAEDGWYEEDADWAKVAATFPELFTAYERRCADRSLRNGEPDAYEAVNGVVLAPGQSRVKDARRFAAEHAEDWIVVSAITSDQRPGFVECIASLGGDRDARDQRGFLVPKNAYRCGPQGFVIDPARHEAFEEPSGFIGWAQDRPSG